MKIEQPSQAKAEVTEKDDMSEVKQSPDAITDLEAFAEVAEKTATTIAEASRSKSSREKALEAAEKQQIEAEEKAVQEAEQEAQKIVVKAGITGAEKLMNDVETQSMKSMKI